MELNYVNTQILTPAFSLLNTGTPTGRNYDTGAARVMLLSIGLQESRFEHRKQIGGPARGFWQFENGGGVKGVLTHVASSKEIERILARLEISKTDVYTAIAWHDPLAAVMARLLLYTDRRPLPSPYASSEDAWQYYLSIWRPGKPHRDSWDACHKQAVDLIKYTNAGRSYQ